MRFLVTTKFWMDLQSDYDLENTLGVLGSASKRSPAAVNGRELKTGENC